MSSQSVNKGDEVSSLFKARNIKYHGIVLTDDNSFPIFIAFQIGVPHFDEFVAKAGKLHSTLK